VRWEQVSATEWIARLPADKRYLSAAVLPDDKPETLALLTRHAYAFIEDTRVDWRYDVAASQVETTFSATTRVMEGPDNGPLLGLYPHHWFDNPSVAGKLGPPTTRCAARSTCWPRRSSRPCIPTTASCRYWPGIRESPRKSELADVMRSDFRNARRDDAGPKGRRAYWQGKGLQRITKLADVAEQQGDIENARTGC
jgi:hypothetical protein